MVKVILTSLSLLVITQTNIYAEEPSVKNNCTIKIMSFREQGELTNHYVGPIHQITERLKLLVKEASPTSVAIESPVSKDQFILVEYGNHGSTDPHRLFVAISRKASVVDRQRYSDVLAHYVSAESTAYMFDPDKRDKTLTTRLSWHNTSYIVACKF